VAADVAVRPARPADRLDVVRVLDAGLLDCSPDAVAARIDDDAALVAADGGRVVGALVADPTGAADADGDAGAHVEAVAVRPNRRGRGVGTALVVAAADRWGRLTADFDARVRPFYESLGFAVEPLDGNERHRGVRE
jgi:GNAT superfamily N-acetyltransferase